MTTSEIKALARMLDRLDYYRLLKVEPGASLGQIKPAYRDARRRFHPDGFLSAESEVRNAVDVISRRITEAYMVLRDHGQRSAYDRTLARGSMRFTAEAKDEERHRANNARGLTANGKRFFAMAEDDERRGDHARALSNLKMALTFEPSNETFEKHIERLEKRLADG